MNNTHMKRICICSGLSLVGALFALGIAQAKPPRSEAQAAQERAALFTAVAKGDALWHSPKLGTNGLACANCHPDGSATNVHTWPKFQTNLGKVGTLREMINWCIAVPMQGKVLEYDSNEMVAMEAYATYAHRGIAIDLGKDEQHGGVPVKSGPGYPRF
ncbi:MAG TPA: cytochrome C [Gammaproteobacteria bacterium]|nr:cytochrome C [Gammaproteobacteria bacterium]